MNTRKECIAMLLAGGQGTRLHALTEKTAKPAVQYGGKYRIIDFTLSNCINSGLDTVGVLTQYQPLALNEYIGSGKPWDLDRANGGLTVLPPYRATDNNDWYKGTANAIYQNLNYIDRYDPDYVLILSGDHIYKMNYAKMLDFHKQRSAACTIAVIDVPLKEASRFGIMNCRDDNSIYKFEEKPIKPESTLASMGIYIFNRDVLARYLENDELDPKSDNDFGRNIIPAMLANGERLFAFPFVGYWRDVGTVSSLWQANMDILGTDPKLDLSDRQWRIYSRTKNTPPQFIGSTASISNSVIGDGCAVYGTVENSVIFENVYIAPEAIVRDSVIMDGVRIERSARVEYSIIDSNTTVSEGGVVGCPKHICNDVTVLGSDLCIGADDDIAPGEIVNNAYLCKTRCKRA